MAVSEIVPATTPDLEAGGAEKVPSIHVRPVSAPPGKYSSLKPPNEVEAKHLREQERARSTSSSSHLASERNLGAHDPDELVDKRNMTQGNVLHTPTVRHKPSQVLSIAASAAPQNFRDLTAIYTVVASRRDSFDSLL